ncbi:MAG: FAD-binding oxidoreductase, partial [Bacteroidales bacterium]|nr:FAD-binding oxidoreductase [Bacteroidales bacterium]
ISRILYSTDASAYREEPLAVFIPCEDYENDIRLLLQFCKDHNTFIIPRAAGTSLAGQVVGKGIVVDVSKNLNKIIEINEKEHWVRVQPGVVLEELNRSLKPYDLFFGPETSTANRCCIGGMVGNNSCGLHSLVYGSVREHLLEAEVILADGNKVLLKQLSKEEFENKTLQNDLEGRIYKYIASVYSKQEIRQLVADSFPDKEVTRRNNGYALDFLCDSDYPNLAKLYCGSEGTLAFATELKLNLVPLPPKHKALLCIHFSRLQDSFTGNLIALRHNPMAVELMDNNIIEAAYRNPAQRNNTFFIKDKPQAILIIEFAFDSEESLDVCLNETIEDFKSEGTAYDFSIVKGEDISKVWGVRKAGLG